ncbi:MAG: hypothetical protein MZV70_53550 [Desulfobacterales bacterium]|nr:hypothetical protein [Desulfobacterales bacterium]
MHGRVDARHRRRGHLGLDRHPRRARCCATRSRPCSKLEEHLGERVIGQDHALDVIGQTHPDRRAPASRTRQAHRASSCSWARAASARPRPRWRWPTCSTAASAT